MPLDASDKIRSIQQLTIFSGYVATQASLNPKLNVSTCTGFYGSTTIHKYDSYAKKIDIEQGRIYFSDCQS